MYVYIYIYEHLKLSSLNKVVRSILTQIHGLSADFHPREPCQALSLQDKGNFSYFHVHPSPAKTSDLV